MNYLNGTVSLINEGDLLLIKIFQSGNAKVQEENVHQQSGLCVRPGLSLAWIRKTQVTAVQPTNTDSSLFLMEAQNTKRVFGRSCIKLKRLLIITVLKAQGAMHWLENDSQQHGCSSMKASVTVKHNCYHIHRWVRNIFGQVVGDRISMELQQQPRMF